MTSLAVRRPLATYYGLTLAIASLVVLQAVVRMAYDPGVADALTNLGARIHATGGYANLLTISAETLRFPGLSGIFVFAAAPTLAALWVAWRGGGGGLRRLLSRLMPVGPDGSRGRAIGLYAGVLAVYACGFAAYDFVAGPDVDPFDRLRHFGMGLAGGALFGALVDEGGTLEELGWRGFAWPLLQDALRRPLVAAGALGALHWAWHLPREVITLMGGAPLDQFLVSQGIFLVLCVALAIVAGYCVNVAGGSVWPAVLVHGGSNVWSKATGEFAAPSFGMLDLRTLLLILLATIVALAAGRRLGKLQQPVGLRRP